jgi:diguanylate cyclase (GGDEF)-like protein
MAPGAPIYWPPTPMGTIERRRRRKWNVVLATAGLMLALAIGFALRFLGLARLEPAHWLLGLALTLVIQAVVWLIPHFGLDERLSSFDPHYVKVPMLAVVVVLNVYIWISPDSRMWVLLAWFAAVLFMAGLVSFGEVAALSAVMALGYVVVVAGQATRWPGIKVRDEIALAAVFWMANLYGGVVFERLRRDRLERLALRSRLAEMALTDALTGLPNRRHFEQALRMELSRLGRYGGRCAVAMMDVDHFKGYNDRQGHAAGDAALRELGQVIQAHLRAGDVGARYGGEEFAVLMLNTDRQEAGRVVYRLRQAVASHPFSHREHQPGGQLTFSAGVAACPDDGETYEALLDRADTALYRAKAAGRNRVVLAQELTALQPSGGAA